MNRLRVASLQCFIRPVAAEDHVRDQVSVRVETPADDGCPLVLPLAYFTVQPLERIEEQPL